MSKSKGRSRVIIIVAALIILALLALLVRSIGQQSDGEPGGQVAPAQEAPAPAAGQIPNEGSPAPLEITGQTVTPNSAAPGAQRAFQASISGEAAQVIMSITGPGGGYTMLLVRGPVNNGQSNWSLENPGPMVPGEYSYSTAATDSDGQTVRAAGSTFIVEQ